MSEIEKLYRNAGIEPTYTDECIITNRYWENEELANEYGTFDKFMEKNCKFGYQDCADECEYAYTKTHYPLFTAEKQIKIENIILQDKKNYNKWIEYNINVYGEWVIRFVRTDKFAPYIALEKTRAETFAKIVNNLWQDLTEEERKQIKEILE